MATISKIFLLVPFSANASNGPCQLIHFCNLLHRNSAGATPHLEVENSASLDTK